jgi:uncharacterized Fe-S cluster protein YjdI
MIQVKWDETVCIHSANCVKKLPNVFKVENGQFVIDESGASEDAIRAVVAECPSGGIKAGTNLTFGCYGRHYKNYRRGPGRIECSDSGHFSSADR